jgi:putative endopeptidase
VGAFYKSFMDSARLETLSGRPISAELTAIRVTRTRAEVARLMGNSKQDSRDPLSISQSTLTLRTPDATPKRCTRTGSRCRIETTTSTLISRARDRGCAEVQQRDPPALYNPMSPAELAAYAPGFPWRAFLRGAGLERTQSGP